MDCGDANSIRTHRRSRKGECNSFWGRKHSEETRLKLRQNHADVSGQNNPMWGKHHSDDTKKKISDADKRRLSDPTNNPMYGRHHSAESCRKISASLMGKTSPRKGVILSEEQKLHISEATKRGMDNPEVREKLRKCRAKQVMPVEDTKIERIVQDVLRENGINFCTHKEILGQPDIFIEPNVCVFCDGDYWHKYPEGRERDRQVTQNLNSSGYIVLRFWEHEIKADSISCLDKILDQLGR